MSKKRMPLFMAVLAEFNLLQIFYNISKYSLFLPITELIFINDTLPLLTLSKNRIVIENKFYENKY